MTTAGNCSGSATVSQGTRRPRWASPRRSLAIRRSPSGRRERRSHWILGRGPDTTGRRGPLAAWPSQLLEASGYFVSRGADGSHLIFDAGPHGFLNGGHAHADALSIVLTVAGEPLFVDPGTGTYTMDPATRDRFRSSQMHNTLVLEGRDHAIPRGAFHWHARTDARMLIARTGTDLDFAVGTHDGYAPHRHIRAIVIMRGVGWLIVDRVVGPGTIAADTWWHLHPSWQPEPRGGSCELVSASGRRLDLRLDRAEPDDRRERTRLRA